MIPGPTFCSFAVGVATIAFVFWASALAAGSGRGNFLLWMVGLLIGYVLCLIPWLFLRRKGEPWWRPPYRGKVGD